MGVRRLYEAEGREGPIAFISDGSLYHQNALNSAFSGVIITVKKPVEQKIVAKVINLGQKKAPAKPADKPKAKKGGANSFAKGLSAQQTLEVTHMGVKQIES